VAEPRELSLGWRLLEAWFKRVYHIEPLLEDPGGLFALNRFHYRGADVPLQCGYVIKDGDVVLEIHFRREALLPLIRSGDPTRMGISLIKLGDRDIPRLAEALRSDPRYGDVRALHALTLFHRGITRYGFEIHPIKEPHLQKWFTWWHRVLMARDHAHGTVRVKEHLDTLVTRHVWVSRDELVRRYPAPKC
jgi:hypothetical protein